MYPLQLYRPGGTHTFDNHMQQTKDWMKKYPPDSRFPSTPPRPSRKNCESTARPPSGIVSTAIRHHTHRPIPRQPAREISCGQESTSQHVLLTYPNFQDARNDILPLARPALASPRPSEMASPTRYQMLMTSTLEGSLA